MSAKCGGGRWWGAACFALLILCGSASAAEGKQARGEFAVMFGFLDGMTIDARAKDTGFYDASIDSDMGWSAGASFDQGVFRSIWLGLTIDVFQLRKEILGGDITAKSINPALRLSVHYQPKGSQWSLRPGVACGAALLEEVFRYKASQYVTLRPFLQVVCRLTPRTGFLIETNMLKTLRGGNDNYDIKAGPSFGVRIGLLK